MSLLDNYVSLTHLMTSQTLSLTLAPYTLSPHPPPTRPLCFLLQSFLIYIFLLQCVYMCSVVCGYGMCAVLMHGLVVSSVATVFVCFARDDIALKNHRPVRSSIDRSKFCRIFLLFLFYLSICTEGT